MKLPVDSPQGHITATVFALVVSACNWKYVESTLQNGNLQTKIFDLSAVSLGACIITAGLFLGWGYKLLRLCAAGEIRVPLKGRLFRFFPALGLLPLAFQIGSSTTSEIGKNEIGFHFNYGSGITFFVFLFAFISIISYQIVRTLQIIVRRSIDGIVE